MLGLKEFRKNDPVFLEYGRTLMNIGLNGVEVSPHGLIFDEDEATGCPMPLEPFPTPFRLVLGPFKAIFTSKRVKPNISENLLYIPLLKGPPWNRPPLFGVIRWIHSGTIVTSLAVTSLGQIVGPNKPLRNAPKTRP